MSDSDSEGTPEYLVKAKAVELEGTLTWAYYIKWKGCPESKNSWEPESSFIHCRQYLDTFWQNSGHDPANILLGREVGGRSGRVNSSATPGNNPSSSQPVTTPARQPAPSRRRNRPSAVSPEPSDDEARAEKRRKLETSVPAAPLLPKTIVPAAPALRGKQPRTKFEKLDPFEIVPRSKDLSNRPPQTARLEIKNGRLVSYHPEKQSVRPVNTPMYGGWENLEQGSIPEAVGDESASLAMGGDIRDTPLAEVAEAEPPPIDTFLARVNLEGSDLEDYPEENDHDNDDNASTDEHVASFGKPHGPIANAHGGAWRKTLQVPPEQNNDLMQHAFKDGEARKRATKFSLSLFAVAIPIILKDINIPSREPMRHLDQVLEGFSEIKDGRLYSQHLLPILIEAWGIGGSCARAPHDIGQDPNFEKADIYKMATRYLLDENLFILYRVGTTRHALVVLPSRSKDAIHTLGLAKNYSGLEDLIVYHVRLPIQVEDGI